MIALLLTIFRLPQSSTVAKGVDDIFNFILITSVISFCIIVFGKLFFLIKFWRKKVPENKTAYIHGHTATELSVGIVLTVWVMAIFWWGWVEYKVMRAAPPDAMEINVIAHQWAWEFQYADGRRLSGELVIPKGKPVKLIMTSQDVIHSFFVPDFRIKQDVLPKAFTSVWFEAIEAGEHAVYCAEYCGAAHSGMLAKVKVLEPDDFEEWQLTPAQGVVSSAQAAAPKNLIDVGKGLYSTKGCNACHTITGAAGVGPTFSKIFGTSVELSDGKKVTVDENYIRESLMEPQAKIVKGFQPIMPTFKGQISDEELNALIGFIKSLKE